MRSEKKVLVRDVARQLLEDLVAFRDAQEPGERWRRIKRIEQYTDHALELLHGEQPTDEVFGTFIDILFRCQELSNYESPGGWAPSLKEINQWIVFLQHHRKEL